MSELAPVKRPPRVVFLGMQGNFSVPSLSALLEYGIEVCAVVVPTNSIPGMKKPPIVRKDPPQSPRMALPLMQSVIAPSIVQIAWKHHIPVWEVSTLSHAETFTTLASYEPDIICVSCFSLRLPGKVLALPRLGCLNVHPSLLPANRGPVPVFWTLKEGLSVTGATVHFMEEEMDRGDILAQATLDVPEGIRYMELENLCARLGGTLLAQAVQDVYANRSTRIVQDEAQSSYYSFPSGDDFRVDPLLWSARHLYNFVRGVSGWGEPVEIIQQPQPLFATDAIAYRLKGQKECEAPFRTAMEPPKEIVWVKCRDGFVCIYLLLDE
jgi:methionyl-tRNA formyltransferase